mgnify:CR=1 FL=1
MSNNSESSNVFVGNKVFMNYVTGVVMQFNKGTGNVCVKARGKYISKAVDIAEVVRNRFLNDVVVKDVLIGSEEFQRSDKKNVRVSTINIVLTKQG